MRRGLGKDEGGQGQRQNCEQNLGEDLIWIQDRKRRRKAAVNVVSESYLTLILIIFTNINTIKGLRGRNKAAGIRELSQSLPVLCRRERRFKFRVVLSQSSEMVAEGVEVAVLEEAAQ